MALIVGLTGGIASGKSTVSNLLIDKGYTVVDADIAARVVVEPGEEAYSEIVAAFGNGILQEDGNIDRKYLGSLIFGDEEKRLRLNSIVHPAVRRKMKEWQDQAILDGKKTVILDIPLLFESDLTGLTEKVLVVSVDEETQVQRLMARDSLTEEEAAQRIASQMPLRDKKKWADAVIDNNGSVGETKQQLEAIIDDWRLEP